MDLSYGDEYGELRAQVRSFLEENWPPKGAASREEGAHQFRQAAIDQGYIYRNIPKQYGGSEQEADSIAAQIIREEFSAKHAPMEIRGIGMMMLVPTLLERAEEWQKEKFVRPTVMGEITWCQGYSEPGSGSDLASLQTRGVLEGDEWVINGQKIWTTSAQEADWMFCLVRTEPDVPKHAGISYLLIPMKQAGVEVRPLKQMNGSAEFNEVFFTDARTPTDHIVGKRGEGWLVSRTTLKHERNSIGAAAATTAMFEGLVQFAKDTKRDGRPAIEDPLVREELARLEGYVRAHEYSGLRQFSKNAKGETLADIAMMNKLHSTNIGDMAAKVALEIMGDDGMLDPLSRESAKEGVIPSGSRMWLNQYMYSLGIAVAGGTANIQRNVIGERGLGLPRDHYANRSSGK
jgi:alkylation response protein AidB-like acyl-CoA dehydrogenase